MPSPAKRTRNDSSIAGILSSQKREKYTMIACNECRKRKIKCSGDTPCKRCGTYKLSCTYADGYFDNGCGRSSKEKFAAFENKISALEAQVEKLSTTVSQIGEAQLQLNGSSWVAHEVIPGRAPGPRHTCTLKTSPTQPQFIGPTSSAFNFTMANNTLQMMGIEPGEQEGSSTADSALPSRCPSPQLPIGSDLLITDPLLSIGLSETYRVLQVYKEEFNPLYPFLPMDKIHALIPSIYEHINRQPESGCVCNADTQGTLVSTKDIKVLKMVIASSLVLEARGKSSLSQRLVDSVEGGMARGAQLVEVDLQELQVLTMMSIYHFHCDEPVLAWRAIGIAARTAIELGLHRRDSLEQNFPEATLRNQAANLFWCIYVLDRRWSFGTGMPFVLQDSDIDPSLPLHQCEPYLECIIAYGRICSKVWHAVAGFGARSVDKDTVAYLDFQIQQWTQNIPPELQLIHPRLGGVAQNQPRQLQLLRTLLYVRANHMRIFVHRDCILSASSISQNPTGARLVIGVAKDTIHVLMHMRETSNIYETQQNAFNYFLVSAISAIFLGVCHAPAEFSQSCRSEFYSALGLLSDLSAHSYISRRLWKSVRGLRQIAPRLGLSPTESLPTDPNANNGNLNNPSSSSGLTTVLSQTTDTLRIMENSFNITPSTALMAASANTSMICDASPSTMPSTFQMGNDFTSLFDALGNHVNKPQSPQAAPAWMTEEIDLLQNGGDVGRLFESLL